MIISINNIRIGLLKFILAVMPLHVLIFNLIDIQALALWRDVLILFLLFGININKMRFDKYVLVVIIRTSICFLFAIIFHDSSMSMSIWMNVLRVYLFPTLIIIFFNQIKITHVQLIQYCKLYVIEAFGASIFGIVQIFLIGRSYLHRIGVGQGSVLLADGTQRNISVFESANVFAIYLVFAIILIIQVDGLFYKKYNKWIVFFGILAGLVLTYSMSAFLCLCIFLFIKLLKMDYRYFISTGILKLILLFILVFFLGLIVLESNPDLFFSLKFQLSEKMNDIISTLSGINRISTSSAAIHYNDFIEGFKLLRNNINGLGFAKESFMISDKLLYLNRNLIGLRESSYLTIMYDYGVFVAIIYLFPYFFPILSKKSDNHKKSKETLLYFVVTILMSYLFLPLIQSYELSFFSFFFIGLFYYFSEENHENVYGNEKIG